MQPRAFALLLGLALAPQAIFSCRPLAAQEGGAALQLRPTIFKARPAPTIERDSDPDDPAFDLKYKLGGGLVYPSIVTQQLSVQTTISGVKEDTVTNSVAEKSWRIESVEKNGDIKLFHQVDSVKMSQRVTGRQEVAYDSRSDREIPSEYESIKGTIGVPLTMVVMNSYGRISSREDLKPQANPGIGDLTLTLPEEPIRVGDSWKVPDEVSLKVDGTPMQIKVRYAYSLLKVSAGLATISYRVEVISPVSGNPRVMSQLVGRMQKGEIKFDIDDGRPISRTVQVEEVIVGFRGDNSSMRYDMRATEEFSGGVAVVAAAPARPASAAGPSPLSSASSPTAPLPSSLLKKNLPGVSTGGASQIPAPEPTPATPPVAPGEPTPAEPRGKVTESTTDPPKVVENSVLVSQHSPRAGR